MPKSIQQSTANLPGRTVGRFPPMFVPLSEALPEALLRHVLVFVSLRDLRSVKAVCRQLLVPARETVRNVDWLTTNAAVIGLLEGSGGSSADGPDMVGDVSNFVEFTAPFTPAPVVEPTPAMRAVEKRKCTACGQHLSSDAFSGKQWPKERRRCMQCLGNASHCPQPRQQPFLPLCVSDCVVLPDGTLALSDPAQRRIQLITQRDKKLGEVRVPAGGGRLYAPHSLACGHGKLYFTSKPPDVNDAAERDHGPYPAKMAGWCTLADLTSSATVEPTLLEWKSDNDDEEEEVEDEDVEEASYKANLEYHGEPLEIVIGGGLFFVHTVDVEIGSRPWEYIDDAYREAEEERAHHVFVYKESATLYHHRFSLGEYRIDAAPRSLACVSSQLIVPTFGNGSRNRLQIWSVAGQLLRTVNASVPPRLQPSSRSLGFNAIHLCAANGRLYMSNHDDLLVFSWNKTTHELGLLQNARVSDKAAESDMHVPMHARCRSALRLCVDEHHVCMLTTHGGLDYGGTPTVRRLVAQFFAVHGGDLTRS